MTQTAAKLAPPTIVSKPSMTIAGVAETHTLDNNLIGEQWKKLCPVEPGIAGRLGQRYFGLCYCDCEETGRKMDYLAGVEVASDAQQPDGVARRVVPAHKHAVFTHVGHVSGVKDTYAEIWTHWMPAYTPTGDPTCVEMYDERFDPVTCDGAFEIWIPIK